MIGEDDPLQTFSEGDEAAADRRGEVEMGLVEHLDQGAARMDAVGID